jgi:uncharacterized Zn finger protein
MSYYNGFPKYRSVAGNKEKALKNLEKLKKKRPDINPIIIEGRKLAKTWWGKAWNDNLESYSDYANRLPRGRSYARNRAILDLKILPERITALVQGTRSKPYEIEITIQPLSKKTWEEIIKACEGKLESLQELLEGSFPKTLADIFTAQDKGLFPTPEEISFYCSCPDYAVMCKHVAAALYGVGSRLDEDPMLFFTLRNVNIDELINKAITQRSETLLKKSDKKSSRVIEDDISSIFGIDINTENEE